MDKHLITYVYLKPFLMPDKIQNHLKEKIEKADFLVADQKATHRLIGIHYDPKKMNSPIITCICMRHEMVMAKQLAFNIGKKIYYHSKASARIFNYYEGEELRFEDFNVIAILYADYFARNNLKK